MSRPPMFIGSSSEGLSIARAIQVELENDVDATIWDQGVFGLSQSSLEALGMWPTRSSLPSWS